MDNVLMRPMEVAKMLGVGRSTAYALIASRTLPVVKIGRVVRVPRVALERWIEEQTQANKSRG